MDGVSNQHQWCEAGSQKSLNNLATPARPLFYIYLYLFNRTSHDVGGRRGHNRILVGFITTYAISAYHHQQCEFEYCSDEVYSIQHYVIKFVSDLW